MKSRLLLAAAGSAALAATAAAGPVKHAGTSADAAGVLLEQDRELSGLAFSTTGSALTGGDFLNFTDGAPVAVGTGPARTAPTPGSAVLAGSAGLVVARARRR